MQRLKNADLNASVEPLDYETVAVLGPWRHKRVAVIPESAEVVGQRLTFAQIARNQIPQLFQRVGFGAVSFGLIEGPENLSEIAELVPLTREHLPHISAQTVIPASQFRRSVARTIASLDEDPGWRFILCRDQVLAALARPSGSSENRAPWYEHLPIEEPPGPILTKADRWATPENWESSFPYPPMLARAVRLDGPWRHANVVALHNSPRFYPDYSLTYEALRQMDMAELRERFVYDGLITEVADPRRLVKLMGLSNMDVTNDVATIVPELTIDAAEFGRDPEKFVDLLWRSADHWQCFLRSGNSIFAQLVVLPR
jgi:hypothetical protein